MIITSSLIPDCFFATETETGNKEAGNKEAGNKEAGNKEVGNCKKRYKKGLR
jgi:hypothetical protein